MTNNLVAEAQRPSRRATAEARAARLGMSDYCLRDTAQTGAFPLWAADPAGAIAESLELYNGPFDAGRGYWDSWD